jgi:hypothetical protein
MEDFDQSIQYLTIPLRLVLSSRSKIKSSTMLQHLAPGSRTITNAVSTRRMVLRGFATKLSDDAVTASIKKLSFGSPFPWEKVRH